MPLTNFPNGVSSYGIPIVSQGVPIPHKDGNVWFVDGTNGLDGNSGKDPSLPVKTIQRAVDLASAFDVVYVFPKQITDFTGDPSSYAETVIIPATKPHMSLIGISHGRTQGGLPQIKKGSGSTAMITVRAAGCLIANLGINGAGSTGAGILLDDDNSAKTAFGTTIVGCHLKNCAPSATLASAGGAITWSAQGNAWQVLIAGNTFYKNTCDICLLGTANSVPQDVIIEDNYFSGPAASVSANLYLSGGSGMNGVYVQRNVFPCFPAAGGTNAPVIMTGCVGMLSWNTFGCSGKTFGAAANILVPTTVGLCGNYQDGALIART